MRNVSPTQRLCYSSCWLCADRSNVGEQRSTNFSWRRCIPCQRSKGEKRKEKKRSVNKFRNAKRKKTRQNQATTKTNPLLAVGPGNEGGFQHVDRRQLACQTKQYTFHVRGEGGRRVHVSILVLWQKKRNNQKKRKKEGQHWRDLR